MAASDDMVREVLARVKDAATLFGCAMVCKAWRGLVVADGSFLVRRCLPEDVWYPSAFSGFVTQRPGCDPPCFVPAPRRHPVLGDGRRSLSSFFSGVPARYFDRAVPLASRHGMLLVRLEPQLIAGIYPDRSGVALAVCDLLPGTVHELPNLEHYWDFEQGRKVSGYALLTAADCCSSCNDGDGSQQRPRFFKVLILTTMQSFPTHYNLHTFSSAADESSGWNASSGVVQDDEGYGVRAMLRQHNAVVLHGAAHWLLCGQYGTYTLHVSAETGHVSTTKMVNLHINDSRCKVYDNPYLTADGEGNLTLLTLKRDGRFLEISTSLDNGRSFQTSTLTLRQPYQWRDYGTNPVYTCLGEKSGMMLVKVNDRRVHIADVNTGVMWEVPYWPCSNGLSRRKVVPFEIYWPAFFASRLDVAM